LNTKFPTQEELSQIPIYDLGVCSVTSSTVNWAGQVTTPIKDQGACGSCWSFVSASQVETDIMRTFGSSYAYELSEEQFLDCAGTPAYPNDGCNGGNYYYGFDYLKTHYIEEDKSYPYTSGTTGNTNRKTCNYDATKGVAGLTSSSMLEKDETCMAQYIQQHGPLAAAVNALNWQNYNPSSPGGSIMTAAACGKGYINHAVQIVGVSIPGKYWIIRNSWGTAWGQQGYMWLEYGKNACNITAQMNTMFTTPFLYTSPTAPSRAPISTVKPSPNPTGAPILPTAAPILPTNAPIIPTNAPVASVSPSVYPSQAPVTLTAAPTNAPVAPTVFSASPTTKAPVIVTAAPTKAPVLPTNLPTERPSPPPGSPTYAPLPTNQPVIPTNEPTSIEPIPDVPTLAPTAAAAPSNGTSSSSTSSAPYSAIGGVAALAGIIVAMLVGAVIVAWAVWYYKFKGSAASSGGASGAPGATTTATNPMSRPDLLL
jgi:hypothetical protein